MTDSYEVEPQAVRALIAAYWSPAGWRRPPDELALAVARKGGLAFAGHREDTHDGWVAAATRAAAAVSLREVSDAFVASLVTRRLDLRSALGSFAVARHLAPHASTGSRRTRCEVCGLHDEASENLSTLNFERFKWGGVRRDKIAYVAFDLEQFQRAPREAVTDEAVAVGRTLLAELRGAERDATVSKLSSRLPVLKGNKEERRVLLEILGVCGVLRTPGHPAHRKSFVPVSARDLPGRAYVDTAYPACWWRGEDGIDEEAVAELLPALAAPGA